MAPTAMGCNMSPLGSSPESEVLTRWAAYDLPERLDVAIGDALHEFFIGKHVMGNALSWS